MRKLLEMSCTARYLGSLGKAALTGKQSTTRGRSKGEGRRRRRRGVANQVVQEGAADAEVLPMVPQGKSIPKILEQANLLDQ
jgi:hypothetical protein